jgi:hypothetical protein
MYVHNIFYMLCILVVSIYIFPHPHPSLLVIHHLSPLPFFSPPLSYMYVCIGTSSVMIWYVLHDQIKANRRNKVPFHHHHKRGWMEEEEWEFIRAESQSVSQNTEPRASSLEPRRDPLRRNYLFLSLWKLPLAHLSYVLIKLEREFQAICRKMKRKSEE